MHSSETIARAFHETYERLAPDHGYSTREASAKPWEEVPEQNRGLMLAVVSDLLARGVIEPGAFAGIEDFELPAGHTVRSTRTSPTTTAGVARPRTTRSWRTPARATPTRLTRASRRGR